MPDPTAIERALCCGLTCGRPDNRQHGPCVAAIHGRAQLTRLHAAGYGIYRREAPDPLPRCGDTVHHIPSGENWIVAWAEGDDIAWAGWPAGGTARCADVRITHHATDEQHANEVAQWLGQDAADDSLQNRIRRLYGPAPETRTDG